MISAAISAKQWEGKTKAAIIAYIMRIFIAKEEISMKIQEKAAF